VVTVALSLVPVVQGWRTASQEGVALSLSEYFSVPSGGPSETVAFTVTNPGSGSQNLSLVTVAVANADGTAWTAVAGCSALDYTIGTPVVTYGQIAPAGFVSGTVTVTMNNLATNQDGCQTADVPLYFVAS